MPAWLSIPGWLDLLDIAVVAGFGWLAIRYLRRTRARAALAGLAVLAAIYFVARSLDLELTVALLQGFFAVVVLVLVVVFQDDLRRVFEQLGSWRRGAPRRVPHGTETADLLVRTAARLASTRTGALIVLPGREPLDRHLEGGVALGGRISEPLLLSIFDASSPGHDGAVIVRGSRVERFAVHLPLSANHAALGPGGTRHAAALGLAERCDALCIAISEERGTISVARDGEIRVLSRPEDLVEVLGSVLQPEAEQHHWWQGLLGWEPAAALAGALVLWMVFVPGSDVAEQTIEVPIAVSNLPNDLVLESVDPPVVDVTLQGPRRDLLLAQRADVAVHVDAYLARLGRRTFSVDESNVRVPDAVSVVATSPDKVKLSLRTAEEVEAGAEAPPEAEPGDASEAEVGAEPQA